MTAQMNISSSQFTKDKPYNLYNLVPEGTRLISTDGKLILADTCEKSLLNPCKSVSNPRKSSLEGGEK